MNKVCILIPNSFGFIDNECFFSVFKMQQFFYEWAIAEKREDTLSLLLHGGYSVEMMRNSLAEEALAAGQTHLLFLDSDMTFPENMIAKMVKTMEDNPYVEAVTGLYVRKTPPYIPQVYPNWDNKQQKFKILKKV